MLEQNNEGYWEKEEFEDLVARGLIGMYESKISKISKKVPRIFKVNDKELMIIRQHGAYFSPGDRETWRKEFQLEVDGMPKYAFHAWTTLKKENWLKDEYLRTNFMWKIANLPSSIYYSSESTYPLCCYKIFYLQMSAKGFVHPQKSWITIDKKGEIFDTYIKCPSTGKFIQNGVGQESLKQFSQEEIKKVAKELNIEIDMETINNPIPTDTTHAAATLGLYQDRRYLWNVTANEGFAKAMFGVYQEQIKSLFYARELPMTETGRKRPILHWVKCHQRRLKNGIDIDIEKHLRGTNEFVYNGTKFTITRPLKNNNLGNIK